MTEVRPKKSRKQANKVRVKLPGIESYEKELEFTAEGPGRVVVRLERLMGSDRIRITDPKYLATLVERLEAEETRSWMSRSRLRKKAEKNRSRQLAIDGLMEPTEDMQDLYNHPVFRVNRVLKRLAAFDQQMAHPGSSGKVPPIHPVEPFCDDDTGAGFKKYSGHRVVYVEQSELPDYESYTDVSNTDMLLGRTKTDIILHAKEEARNKASGQSSKSKTTVSGDEDDEEEGDEEEGDEDGDEEEDEEVEEEALENIRLEDLPDQLVDLQKLYGVPEEEDLVRNWNPYRSQLVDGVYDGAEAKDELYGTAEDVTGAYLRQQITAEDYVAPLEEDLQNKMESLIKGKPEPPPEETSQLTSKVASKVESKVEVTSKKPSVVAVAPSKAEQSVSGEETSEGQDEEEEEDEEEEKEEELEQESELPVESEKPESEEAEAEADAEEDAEDEE